MAQKRRARKARPSKNSSEKKRSTGKPKKATATTRAPQAARRRARRVARTQQSASVDKLTARASAAITKNRRQARALVKEIQKRLARIRRDFHAIGVALRRLSERPVYSALGYDSFAALLKGERLMAKATAYKLIAVADAFEPGEARQMGLEKAYALTRFVEATPVHDIARTLAAENARIAGTPVDEITVRKLRDATRRVNRSTGKARPLTEGAREAKRKALELQRALRAAGAKSARVRAVRLEGEWHLRTDLLVDDADAWFD